MNAIDKANRLVEILDERLEKAMKDGDIFNSSKLVQDKACVESMIANYNNNKFPIPMLTLYSILYKHSITIPEPSSCRG